MPVASDNVPTGGSAAAFARARRSRAVHGVGDVRAVPGAYHACNFLAVFQQHQRGPELDAEAAPQRLTRPVLHPDVPPWRGLCQCLGDRGLGGTAMTTPGGAEFENGQTWQRVNVGARRRLDVAQVGIGCGHVRIVSHPIPPP